MYIKEIILDGFKSYANRTVIGPFDPNFNAITGLNGSGKSNILDSICFVLGISHLQNVRVSNLQELVYKQGQARVTIASVSIVFNNSDKKESPAGYESCKEITVTRQIIVGGRNKYMINGHSAQVGRIQSFFHSVHLNINNPHFLIMQGKITKVLSMKPLEILGLVEEAAGTKMYEIRRNNAQKVIKRKETKLKQIDKTLKDEITPQLEKLKKQKTHFMTWTSNKTEIERLKRFEIAFLYFSMDCDEIESKKNREELEKKIGTISERIFGFERLIQESKGLVEKLNTELSKIKNEQLIDTEKSVKLLSKNNKKEKAILENKKSSLRDENVNLNEVNQNIQKFEIKLKNTTKIYEENKIKFEKVQESVKELTKKLKSLQGRQLGVAVGKKGEKIGSLTSQIIELQKSNAKMESEIKNFEIRIKNSQKSLKDKRKEAEKHCEEKDGLNSFLKNKEKDVKELEQKINQIKNQTEKLNSIDTSIKSIKSQLRTFEFELDKFHPPKFNFVSPNSSFNRSDVYGFVGTLFSLKDKKFTEAIEITAGSKLKNVVIKTQYVGKQLLKYGKLERRATMIPLDKVVKKKPQREYLERIKQSIKRKDIYFAIDCIVFDEKVRKAMEYVFATTIICPSIEIAKRVSYGGKIRYRTVTIDGDLFEPLGTLTGGYRPKSFSFLNRMAIYKKIKNKILKEENELKDLYCNKKLLINKMKKMESLIKEKELIEHEIKVQNKRYEKGRIFLLEKNINDLEENCEKYFEMKKKKIEEFNLSQKKLEELKQQTNLNENGTKWLENQIECTQKQFKELEKVHNLLKLKVIQKEVELKTIKEEIKKCKENKIKIENDIKTLKNEEKECKEKINQINNKLEKNNKKLTKEKSKIEKINKEILENETVIENKEKEINSAYIEKKKVENDLKRTEKSVKQNQLKLEKIEKEYKWIKSEKGLFGKKGGDYDFQTVKPDVVHSRLKSLCEQQQDLSSRINKKVLVMFDKAEQDYNNLIKKRKIVFQNKSKIEKVISELDKKKKQVLSRTFEKVDKNLCSIFKTLLPGVSAKLKKTNPDSLLFGIEVAVSIGGTWKESLSELSGGQRSLLALALILSLLLFKPAPMYVLDEVDAALDLSHTQNIGRLLTSHFACSQFIVVSLKEGMFNHANVLFNVRFEKGLSVVSRTEINKDNGEN